MKSRRGQRAPSFPALFPSLPFLFPALGLKAGAAFLPASLLALSLAAAAHAHPGSGDGTPAAAAPSTAPSMAPAPAPRTLVARMGHDLRKTFAAPSRPVFRRDGRPAGDFDAPTARVADVAALPVIAAVAQKPASRTAQLVREAGERIAQQANARAARQARQADAQQALARAEVGARQRGTASWYADSLHGELTANGERYDRRELTAAHQTLPLGTWVKVTRVGSPRSVLVRVNDRGPFAKRRILDLSYEAARALGMIGRGTAQVVVEVVPGPADGLQRVASSP